MTRVHARLGKAVGLVGWALLGAGTVVWGQGRAWPAGGAAGPIGYASVGGYVAFAMGNWPVRCEVVDRASRGWPHWQVGTARFVVAPDRRWAPSTSSVTLAVGAATTRTSVLWIPACWLVAGGAMLLGSGAGLRRMRGPGECSACGYSNAGLSPGAPCPECGASANGNEARC
ncbi:MAG: hypothetical protein WAZ94_14610 [Phycisphaerales bacterium]